MINIIRYIILLLTLMFSTSTFTQEVSAESDKETFVVRGSVFDKETYRPIPKVNILVNGGAYTSTNSLGEFKIKVSKSDELIIKHSNFETIYYIIQSNERIRVEVEPNDSNNDISKITKRDAGAFKSLIDSADTYLKKDAEKSIQFIAEALAVSNSTKQNAEVYETLGDIYFEWKQYDLAISNYRISLQNIDENDVRLKLAKSFQFNENYQESIDEYLSINKSELSNWQLTSLYEGLGDVYVITQDLMLLLMPIKKGFKWLKSI